MVYKPYKKGKNPDIYAKYDKQYQKENKKSGGKVKIFGFRSRVAYKIIPALVYYAFAWFYIGMAMYGEFEFLKFTTTDLVLFGLKYIFFFIILFSPAIFLSDFKYVDALPLFKKRRFGSSLAGLILVWMFCYFMMNINTYYMSDMYKESVKNYDKTIKEKQEQLNKKKEKETENTTIGKENFKYNYKQNILYI